MKEMISLILVLNLFTNDLMRGFNVRNEPCEARKAKLTTIDLYRRVTTNFKEMGYIIEVNTYPM